MVSKWIDGAGTICPRDLLESYRGELHVLTETVQKGDSLLNSGNPAGFERFFADLDGIVRHFKYGSPQFLAELKKVYPKHNTEILGSAPQG